MLVAMWGHRVRFCLHLLVCFHASAWLYFFSKDGATHSENAKAYFKSLFGHIYEYQWNHCEYKNDNDVISSHIRDYFNIVLGFS